MLNFVLFLQENNIDAATSAKYALEQKQRMGAAERKENGTQWKTEHFTAKPDTGGASSSGEWVYNTPLKDRLFEN